MMKKIVIYSMVALLVISSVIATGVLIRSATLEGGFNDVGYFEYQDGELDNAEDAFLAAIDANPEYQTARYNLATLYNEQERYVEAAAHLEVLVSLDDQNPQYYFDWAANVIAELRKNGGGDMALFDAAIEAYRTADELQPGFPHALENVAVLENIKALATA
jgi:tetratricopeptide (TPR) repeat protein